MAVTVELLPVSTYDCWTWALIIKRADVWLLSSSSCLPFWPLISQIWIFRSLPPVAINEPDGWNWIACSSLSPQSCATESDPWASPSLGNRIFSKTDPFGDRSSRHHHSHNVSSWRSMHFAIDGPLSLRDRCRCPKNTFQVTISNAQEISYEAGATTSFLASSSRLFTSSSIRLQRRRNKKARVSKGWRNTHFWCCSTSSLSTLHFCSIFSVISRRRKALVASNSCWRLSNWV